MLIASSINFSWTGSRGGGEGGGEGGEGGSRIRGRIIIEGGQGGVRKNGGGGGGGVGRKEDTHYPTCCAGWVMCEGSGV